MNRLLISVALASAEEHQAARRDWWERRESIPLRWRCGGRCATINLSLEAFARRFGDPHESAPVEHWRNYHGHDLLDGAGKVSAIWYFQTPRGPVQVHDYWWNKKDELSIAAPDMRSMRWFLRWCENRGIPATPPRKRKGA